LDLLYNEQIEVMEFGPTGWVDSLQVSSVQFVCREHTSTLARTTW